MYTEAFFLTFIVMFAALIGTSLLYSSEKANGIVDFFIFGFPIIFPAIFIIISLPIMLIINTIRNTSR